MKYIFLAAMPFAAFGIVFGIVLWIGKSKSKRAMALADHLGMRKMDEMERIIQYKAVSIAYTVVLFALLGITFYSTFVKRESMPLSNFALLLGVLTQSGATLVLRHRSTQGDEEYKTYPLWKTALWILGVSALIGALGGLLVIVVLAS
ncbi:hypothetical protein [Agathobaculum sp.]|uniref:hypothetical protein n=1 Tax=Agathobaculum sp. TaxID=2048138 RepID=UPI002A82669B|nr:hypothetical protein [Agathobaculum sp.]MDY3618835.1 hypothetical protein [Agathobaculum sp.]